MMKLVSMLAMAGLFLAGCGDTSAPAGGPNQPVPVQHAAVATRGTLSAVVVKQGPPVDGTLKSPIWQQCPPLALGQTESQEIGPLKTTARVLLDDKNLYVAWECLEPDTSILKTEVAGRDDDTWRDDSVELFISADPKAGHAHFAINSKGVLADYFAKPDDEEDVSWNSSAVVKATLEKDKRWIVTMSVPLKELGAFVGDGQTWAMNLNRTRPLSANQWVESTWSDKGRSRYKDAEGWGKLINVRIVRRPDGVTKEAPAK